MYVCECVGVCEGVGLVIIVLNCCSIINCLIGQGSEAVSSLWSKLLRSFVSCHVTSVSLYVFVAVFEDVDVVENLISTQHQ